MYDKLFMCHEALAIEEETVDIYLSCPAYIVVW